MNMDRERLFSETIQRHQFAWQGRISGDLFLEAEAVWLGLNTSADKRNFVTELCGRSGGRRTYRDVAASGFLASAFPEERDLGKYLREGVAWLTARPAVFERTPTGIAVDGLALFAVTVGVVRLGDDVLIHKVHEWLSEFLQASIALPGIPIWQNIFMRVAAKLVNVDGVPFIFNPEAIDVYLVLNAHGILLPEFQHELDAAASDFCENLGFTVDSNLEPERLALRLAALNARQKFRMEQPAKRSSKNKPGKEENDTVIDEKFLINAAKKSVPSFKWVLGSAALMALAAVIVRWGFNLATLFLVAGVLLVAAMGFIALQWVQKVDPKSRSRMAGFVAWSLLLFLIGGIGLVFSSAVMDRPWSLRSWIERQINGRENKTAGPNGTSTDHPAMSRTPTNESTVKREDLKLETELVPIKMSVELADDSVRITVNHTKLHEGGPTNFPIEGSLLRSGTNVLTIDVYNNPTRTGGMEAFGGAQKEGWGYSCALVVGENSFPYSGTHGNQPPDSQWGKWFRVRTVLLLVDENSGRISVREASN